MIGLVAILMAGFAEGEAKAPDAFCVESVRGGQEFSMVSCRADTCLRVVASAFQTGPFKASISARRDGEISQEGLRLATEAIAQDEPPRSFDEGHLRIKVGSDGWVLRASRPRSGVARATDLLSRWKSKELATKSADRIWSDSLGATILGSPVPTLRLRFLSGVDDGIWLGRNPSLAITTSSKASGDGVADYTRFFASNECVRQILAGSGCDVELPADAKKVKAQFKGAPTEAALDRLGGCFSGDFEFGTYWMSVKR